MALAVNAGHQQLQMDGNFRCMEMHIGVTYPANSQAGIAPTASYKSIRNVWNATGTVGAAVPTSPITPATEDWVNNAKLIGKQAMGLNALSTQYRQQRWYERELKAVLMIPPAADTVLVVDYYGFLPDYANPTDSDWFSVNVWMCLLFSSAWMGSISLWEDANVAYFESRYRGLLQQAIEFDQQIKQGAGRRLSTGTTKPQPTPPPPPPAPPQPPT